MTSPKPILCERYRIADMQFEVIAGCAEARRIWTNYSHKFCVQAISAASGELSRGQIEIHDTTQITLPSLADWSLAEVEHGQCWTDGAEMWLAIAGSHLFVTSSPAPRVAIWLGTSAEARTDIALEAVIAYALSALLRRGERYSLHAAGLREPNTGQGILLVGDSGSGKSTMTVRLAQQGWQYVSDDQIALHANAQAITASGLRQVFSLTPETLQACWNTAGSVAAPHDKTFVEPQAFFAGQAISSFQPTRLFFTKLHPAEKTTVTELPPSEAMLKLIRQCPWLCYDPAVAHAYTHVLTRLTEQCRAYQIAAGRELLEQPTRAHELMFAYLH